MTIVRRIDPGTGGIATSGRHFVTGVEATGQLIVNRLRLYSGEFFRDNREGTPWFDVIFSESRTLAAKEAAIKSRILQTPGVVELLSFTVDFNLEARALSVRATALSEDGLVELTEVFSG